MISGLAYYRQPIGIVFAPLLRLQETATPSTTMLGRKITIRWGNVVLSELWRRPCRGWCSWARWAFSNPGTSGRLVAVGLLRCGPGFFRMPASATLAATAYCAAYGLFPTLIILNLISSNHLTRQDGPVSRSPRAWDSRP